MNQLDIIFQNFYRGGWIGFPINGFGLKKRTDCGFVWKIEQIRGFWKHSRSWIGCNFWHGFLDCACLDVRILGPKRNLDYRSFFSLGWYVNEFIQIISFLKEVHLNSGVRQLLELYSVVLIKHVAFFTIWAKLTVAVTCTSLPLNLYTSVFGCGCGFGFDQKLLAAHGSWLTTHRFYPFVRVTFLRSL